MAIKVMANCGEQVLYTAEELGAALRTFANNTDYVIKGIGSQMSMSYNSSSLEVTVKTGEAVMCGRFIMVNSNEKITLPANTSGKLVLRIDLTKPVTKEGLITYVTNGNIKSDNLNNLASGQYDLYLADFVTSSSGVTSLTDKRVIKDAAGSGGSEPTPDPEIQLDLLWTNANLPTDVASAVPGPTANISNLSSYKMIFIHCLSSYAPRGTGATNSFENWNAVYMEPTRPFSFKMFLNVNARVVTINNNSVVFGNNDNGYVVPWHIYGLK